MKIDVRIILDQDEVSTYMPYEALVESWSWLKTFTGKRILIEHGLTIVKLMPYYRRAMKYHSKGCPKKVSLTPQELNDWTKICEVLSVWTKIW